MAKRSVFITRNDYPYFEEIQVEMDWFGGFAPSQARKCQVSLHENFKAAYPDRKVLEISTKSLYSLGSKLSAMNLRKQTKAGLTTVESAFQSSRIYEDDLGTVVGPFPEWLFLPGKECKAKVKEQAGKLHSHKYRFDGMDFTAPNYHISLFYDFLYLNALCEDENREVARQLVEEGWDAFTDLAAKSLNSQARSAAIYVSLVRNGKIDQVKDFRSYMELFRTTVDGKAMGHDTYQHVQILLDDKGNIKLYSPVVQKTFTEEQVQAYYNNHCSTLTNKMTEDNYLA